MIIFGLLIFSGQYVQTEETSSSAEASDDPMDMAYGVAKETERLIAEERGGKNRSDDKSVAVLIGITLIAGGALFLIKSNDKDFLPEI